MLVWQFTMGNTKFIWLCMAHKYMGLLADFKRFDTKIWTLHQFRLTSHQMKICNHSWHNQALILRLQPWNATFLYHITLKGLQYSFDNCHIIGYCLIVVVYMAWQLQTNRLKQNIQLSVLIVTLCLLNSHFYLACISLGGMTIAIGYDLWNKSIWQLIANDIWTTKDSQTLCMLSIAQTSRQNVY